MWLVREFGRCGGYMGIYCIFFFFVVLFSLVVGENCICRFSSVFFVFLVLNLWFKFLCCWVYVWWILLLVIFWILVWSVVCNDRWWVGVICSVLVVGLKIVI